MRYGTVLRGLAPATRVRGAVQDLLSDVGAVELLEAVPAVLAALGPFAPAGETDSGHEFAAQVRRTLILLHRLADALVDDGFDVPATPEVPPSMVELATASWGGAS